MEKSFGWRRALVGGATFLAVGIGGLVVNDALNGPEATRDEATQQVVESGNEDALALRVGDCFDDIDGQEFSRLPVVPCDQPHANEIFGSYTLPAGEWPGDKSIQDGSVAECDARFEDFVGLSYEKSTLDWWIVLPSEDGWNTEDDREVLCVAFDPDGDVTGTLEAATR